MGALLAASLLSLQIGLLSAGPHTKSEEHLGDEHLEHLEHLSRQTRESHHLSRASADPHRRARVSASPRPSRAFRQPPVAAQSSQSQPPAERRTFITVLLAAEVAYLEGLLATRLAESAAKEERKKKPRHAPRPTEVVHLHPASRQPYAQAAPPVTEKYVSQLDPFFMLDAPDLSAGGPSQGYEVGPNQRIEVEEDSGYQLIHQAAPEPTYAPPSPQPTYGAFPLYSGPAEAQIVTAGPTTTTPAPVVLEDSNHPTPAPRKRLVRGHSRGNWGDFELYHPGGYLPAQPSQPRKQRELSKKEKAFKKEFKAAPARAEVKEKKKPTGKPIKKEQKIEYNLVYRPSPAVAPPSPSSPTSTLRGSPSSKTSTAYRGGSSPPITTYKPIVHKVKTSSHPRPDSATPSKKPRTAATPTRGGNIIPTRGSILIGPKRQKTSAPPLHPHTFFHEEQAKQVHKGDWPPVYYNSIHNQHIKVRRI